MPWLVHLLTASGAVLGLLAAMAAVEGDARAAFAWLFAAVVVDAGDGYLARLAGVKARVPWLDGALLDNIVDYQTYVFVPALLVWRLELVPAAGALPAGAAMLLSSAVAFSRTDAKTHDHFFMGFPSLWNVVVFYLAVFGASPATNLVVLLVLAVLTVVPTAWVYPSRTPAWQALTLVLGVAWTAAVAAMLWTYPDVPRRLVEVSLVYPVYYVALSVVLDARRRRQTA